MSRLAAAVVAAFLLVTAPAQAAECLRSLRGIDLQHATIPELQAARYADIAVVPGQIGGGYGLGAGVEIDVDTGCITSVSHAGAEPGYGSNIAYYPKTGAVFAMLGNGDGGTGTAVLEVTKALAPLLGPVLKGSPPTEPCAAPWG